MRYGERLGWPELWFKPGEGIGAGVETWRRFSQAAKPELLQAAVDAAKREEDLPF